MYAQCPEFNDCFTLLASDGCSYTFLIEVEGDTVFRDEINPFDAHLVQWNFSITGTGEIVSSGFSDELGDLALNTEISISNTASTVTVSYFDLNNPIEAHRLVGGHFIFTVESAAGSCFTVKRSGINSGLNFGGAGVCNALGICDDEEYCSQGRVVNGNVTAPAHFYDCPDTENHGIEGVNITVISSNGDTCTTGTANDGTYSCVFCDEGPFNICAEADCPDPCGVTDIDLVLLRKYVLGVFAYDKNIWFIGDVDNNKSIRTLDLVRLQREILGIDTNFVENWCRFVPVSDYSTAPNPNGPNSGASYQSIGNCVSTANGGSTDFLRYMVGDVDGSCTDCIHGDEEGDLPIVIDNDGSDNSSRIKSTKNDKIHALTLHIPIPDGTQVYKISSPLPGFEYAIKDNEVHFIWLDLTEDNVGFEARAGEVILEVETNGTNILSLSNQENYWLSAVQGIKKITTAAEPRSRITNQSLQNMMVNNQYPIEIESIQEEGNLMIYDTYGRVVASRKIDKSTSNIEVDLHTGVYIFFIEDESGIQSQKILISN